MILRILLVLILAGCATVRRPASSGSEKLEIPAAAVDSSSVQATGAHIAYWNPLFSNGKLLITLGGTASRPSDFTHFAAVAAGMGYAVLSVDYPNSVITTKCASREADCFDRFRREINTGQDVSEFLTVNESNSILHRIRTLLVYMAARDPRWLPFLNGDQVLWEKTVLAGHSQGAGHAAYISKRHAVERVILLAGPQDTFEGRPALWVRTKGKTSGDRYRALLHREDAFGTDKQLKVFEKLCACKDPKNVILTEKPEGNPHMAVIFPQYREEWAQLLAPNP